MARRATSATGINVNTVTDYRSKPRPDMFKSLESRSPKNMPISAESPPELKETGSTSLKFSSLESSTVTDEVRLIAEEELTETEEKRKSSLQNLKQILASEQNKNNSRTDDEFLLQFLRARKFNCKAALKLIKKYYAHRLQYPDLYKHFTPEENLHVMKANIINYLPFRSPEGQAVFATRFGRWDPESLSFQELLRFGLLCNEKALENPVTQICGTTALVNLEGLTLYKVLQCSVLYLRCFVTALQDCMPMRIKAVHVLNAPRIFTLLFTIIKPLLKTKIKNRIHFHGSDLEDLHRHLPAEMLPEEFGGTSGIFHNEEFYNSLLDSQEQFVANKRYCYRSNSQLDSLRQLIS